LLTNKTYADGKGTAYTYTSGGRLASRTWARGVTTTFGYDANAGNLLTLGYSVSTPGLTFTYDRVGRQKPVADGTGSRAFTNNDALQLAAETNALATTVTRSYDALGRPAGFGASGGYAGRVRL
jgi:YD repeat-containing protein